jgi:hypothetical protein
LRMLVPLENAGVTETVLEHLHIDGGDSCYATDPAAFLLEND